MLNKIRNYISEGNIAEAIELIQDTDIKVIFSSDLRDIKHDERMGLQESSNISLRKRQLSARILDQASKEDGKITGNNNIIMSGIQGSNISIGGDKYYPQPRKEKSKKKENKMDRGTLLLLRKKHIDINPGFAAKCKSLADEIRDHEDEKEWGKKSYDYEGEIEKNLQTRYEAILKEESELQVGKDKKFLTEIEELLEGIPSYEKLEEAYIKCQSKGMFNEYIDNMLDKRFRSDEIKVDIKKSILLWIEDNF